MRWLLRVRRRVALLEPRHPHAVRHVVAAEPRIVELLKGRKSSTLLGCVNFHTAARLTMTAPLIPAFLARETKSRNPFLLFLSAAYAMSGARQTTMIQILSS